MPFLYDVDAHVRFLIALPLLVVSELVVHQRMRPVIRQFVERGLIVDAALAKLDAPGASALRLRNSVVAEGGLSAFKWGSWTPARKLFQPTAELFRGDGLSKFYLALCDRYERQPPGEGWKGVVELEEK